jgi:hypothetical protein
MTDDLKEYTESLSIFVYRMIDGSTVLAEETHRDLADEYVVISRPLQIIRGLGENSVKTLFIPWMGGEPSHIRVAFDRILAEAEATFEEKFAYCRYFLLERLEGVMTPEEMSAAVKEDVKTVQKKTGVEDLMANLKNQKRMELN